jgi:hypothetical protein
VSMRRMPNIVSIYLWLIRESRLVIKVQMKLIPFQELMAVGVGMVLVRSAL